MRDQTPTADVSHQRSIELLSHASSASQSLTTTFCHCSTSACIFAIITALIFTISSFTFFVVRDDLRRFLPSSLGSPPADRVALAMKDVCTFVIMCGTGDTDTVTEMRPLLISAILLTSCPLRSIFMADEESAGRVHEMFAKNLTIADKPLTVDIWTVSTDWIDNWARRIKYNPHGHHSGSWGTAKLIVPWLLRDLDRVIVIDSDMIFLDDPASLWAQFDDEESWAYKMPLFDGLASTSICSCVVLMNIPNIYENRVYPNLFGKVLLDHPDWYNEGAKLYVPPQGDQGLYWGLMKSHPKLVTSLADRFNVDHCHHYYGSLRNSSEKMVSILHKNCDNVRSELEQEADIFFDYYWAYKWQWLRGLNETGFPVEINMISHNASSAFDSGGISSKN